MNLISISQLFILVIQLLSSPLVAVQDPQSKQVIGIGNKMEGIYVEELHVLIKVASSVDLSSFLLTSKSSMFDLWYFCLGHISSSHLTYLVFIDVLGNLNSHNISNCSGSKASKIYITF